MKCLQREGSGLVVFRFHDDIVLNKGEVKVRFLLKFICSAWAGERGTFKANSRTTLLPHVLHKLQSSTKLRKDPWLSN